MKRKLIEGTIQGNEKGYGFLIPFDTELEDFFIPHGELRGAMHKDTVLCEATSEKGERTVARVLKIIERGLYEIVGTYTSSRSGGFVKPDDKKYFSDIFIPSGKGVKAKTGDKVVCKIYAFPHGKCPEGLIKEILGKRFTRLAELKSIEKAYGLENVYPKKAQTYANYLKAPTEQDLVDRCDYRNLLTMTIDGEDSRDFDDAVSIEKHKDGSYLLGVHIADVTHYVKEGCPIDVEAYKRGTSVYFPESVIPMLPERLCNDLCSLTSGVDRLTLSCIISIDKKGRVYDFCLKKSVINSKARLTYNKVQAIIDGDKKLIKEYSNVASSVFLMNELTDVLISCREKNGYVNLDVKESLVSVDQKGQISVTATPIDKAHRIIEEFMILANVCIATFAYENKIPFIYRVHERPDQAKYEFFLSFLAGLGLNVKYNENLSTVDYQNILDNAVNHPAFNVINRVMLRSMQKAKYSDLCKQHFGLGEEYYCHFTSPIRRYPDLYVHRILKDFLANGKDFVFKKYSSVASAVALKSSQNERNAMEAERAVDDYYKVLYISSFLGEQFEGVISGVTSFGIFVELANGIEGLVKIESLEGGQYSFDDRRFVLSDGVHKYKLGESVTIVVAGVDMAEKRAEFTLVC